MGTPKEPGPAKLFMSVITLQEKFFEEGVESLQGIFGKVDALSQRFPFDQTDYYSKEMGSPLFRRFITFEKLISIPALPEIKRATNDLEQKYSTPDGKRRLNIDPGYLCRAHVILATTKGYVHRPYLRDGIYADLTLIFRDKSFRALEWTYPDYQQEEIILLFNQFRKRYLEELKREKGERC